jgi:hypothetical protein
VPGQDEATPGESEKRISPWYLLLAALVTGAALTAIADLIPGSPKLSAIDWLGATVGVAALFVAVGIYRLQEKSGNEAHAELMDQLEAQNELLNEFAKRSAEKNEASEESGALTTEQRDEVEARFGADSIASAIDPGRGRGGRGRGALLVRLNDGRLVSVYDRRGKIYVREIGDSRGRGRGFGR